MIAGTVALAILAGLLFAAAVLSAQDRLIRRRLKERIVMTLKSGEAFNGLLCEIDMKTVVLRDAKVLNGTNPVPVDGELIVARADINYLQRP